MRYGESAYINDVASHSLLTKKETNDLILLAQKGDIEARNKVITHNMRWVIKISKRYYESGLDQEDLISEGVLGLEHAIRKFNPEKAVFSTYSFFWIHSYMDRASMDKGRSVRIPIQRSVEYRKILKFQKDYEAANGCLPSLQCISEEMGFSREKSLDLIGNHQGLLSLDYQSLSDESLEACDPLVDFLKSEDFDFADEADKDRLTKILKESIATLPEKWITIISLRFGLFNSHPRSLSEIAKIVGLSIERVRQIQIKSIESLRDMMTD